MSSPVPERFRSTSAPEGFAGVPYDQQNATVGVPSTLAITERLTFEAQGRQNCLLGQHAYTPWTPPDEQGVAFCWCARGCGYWVRSDELR